MLASDTTPTATLASPSFKVIDDLPCLIARLRQPAVTELLVDTETLGLPGLPFLLQIEDPDTREPRIVRVRDHAPALVFDLLKAMARPSLTLVGHNLVFDIAKLTHLATVASVLAAKNETWSSETVWRAERLWRPGEATFEERLRHIKIFWPGACVDTYLAALRLPPFGNELQNDPGITFRRMPVSTISRLWAKLKENLNKDAGDIKSAWRLGDHMKWRWADNPSSAEKKRRNHAMDNQDHRVLADVRFYIRMPLPYSLKTLAPMLGYEGEVQRQEFEDIFGSADDSFPVWTERGGPKSKECGFVDAWEKSLELERDPTLLQYAADDISMLRIVYDHYRADSGFPALRHDMALVSWAAAVRMTGVHVDEKARDEAMSAYESQKKEALEHCTALGLKNPNSVDQVIDYVNRNVIKIANDALPEDDDEGLDEIDNSRRKDTLEPLAMKLKAERQRLESAASDATKIKQAQKNLDMLIQARVFERKLQFLESIKGDSVFPQFHISGTQTDRMSCSNPNSQQMPSPDRETEWEKKQEVHFRAMFAPPAGWQMFGGDFDQLELRVKSGVTEDPFTQGIYAKETDNDPADEHSESALKVFNKDLRAILPEHTDEQILALLKSKDKRVKHLRAKVKPIGFGIPYGATKFGIAYSAECSEDEAEKMLAEYWKYCQFTKQAIDTVHKSVVAIHAAESGFGVEVKSPAATAVTNKVGVTRRFAVALRLVYVVGKMADQEWGGDGRTYLQRCFPDLASSAVIVRRGTDFLTGLPLNVPVLKALRSALRGGAFGLQQSVQRQSFNFLIQSLGAYLTKELQGRVFNTLITPGVWTGAELPILCGLQVHDEIHYFARNAETLTLVNELVKRFLLDATELAGCPIRFHFERITSWAHKA